MNNRIALERPHVGSTSARTATGSTLLVVMVLLLLATLFVVFALNVGSFEQRTSGNDLRAKLAQETAESGIALGVEYLNANRTLFATNDTWRECGASETDFPCGAVPATRRATMFTYMAEGSGGAALADRLLPLQAELADSSVGGFGATRQVGAVLCRVREIPATGATPAGTECTDSLDDASTTWVATLVSKGSLTGEGSSATVSQTIGAYNIFAAGVGTPPLVASGSVDVGGGMQVVTSPDAAGSGVPTSIWSRLDVGANGTPNTCYFDNFIRQGGSNSGPPGYFDGIAVCDTCKCPTDNSLSFGKGADFCEGMDIVDIESDPLNVAGCPTTANANIRREEFPEDLFAFLFGQSAWTDVNRGGIAEGDACTTAALDCHFGEERIILADCKYPHPTTGAEVTASLPADTCYLLNIRNKIHIGDGVDDQAQCDALGADSEGVIWVHEEAIGDLPGFAGGCDRIRGLNQFGSPSKPVALVYDGSLTQVNGLVMYGLAFLREPNSSTTLDPATGGSAVLGVNGNMTIYGAAVVQGKVQSGGGGSAAIVYNKDVLFNLINNPNNINPASIPGSWTDRLRY
ncbi:hypothetical protein [Lysobacter sp. D1-1-M9]|uniref:hypothetical protein n=1 Tax=Novilysobacter longmucuonensis TaxID=3098603 RepID=UPI002FC8ED2D